MTLARTFQRAERALVGGIVGAATIVLLGCDAPAVAPSLKVEVGGCSAWLTGPTCEVDPRSALRLWVKSEADAKLTFARDGFPFAAQTHVVDGGQALTAEVLDAQVLTVVAERDGARTRFRLPLALPREPTVIREARSKRLRGDIAGAEALLEGPATGTDPRPRAAALALLGRIHLAQDAVRGRAELLESAGLAQGLGRTSEALSDTLALAYDLTFNARDYGAARRALDAARSLADGLPEGHARTLYFEGVFAYEAGHAAEASLLLEASVRAAQHVGLTSYLAAALPLRTDLALSLGRLDLAQQQLDEGDRLAATLAQPCDVAGLSGNLGWARVVLADHTGKQADLDAALGALSRALDITREACPRHAYVESVLTSLARARALQGNWSEALAKVAEARAIRPEPAPDSALVWAEIEAENAFFLADLNGALEKFEALGKLADRLGLPDARSRADRGRGDVLAAQGRVQDADLAYVAADSRASATAATLSLGAGRLGKLGTEDAATRARIALHLEREPTLAASIARQALARTLSSVAWSERLASLSPNDRAAWDDAVAKYKRGRAQIEAENGQQWQLSELELERAAETRRSREAALAAELDAAAQALRPPTESGSLRNPDEGELLLVYYPLPRGWAGFAVSAQHTVGLRLSGDPSDNKADPELLASLLLKPFHDLIAQAKTISVIAQGALGDVDLHALPFENAPLIAHAPVVYRLDTPSHPRAVAPDGPAFVVGDPRGDLPKARDEAARVTALLAQRASRITSLARENASYERVAEGLGCGDFARLHFAGHGRFAGPEGLASGLALADGAWLTATDVLAMPTPPAEVVLSGCETAKAGTGTRAVGVGMAHAFLLAGSVAAVAATRPIGDELGKRFMTAYYGAEPSLDVGARLRLAMLSVQQSRPDLDWAAFRALAP